MTVFEVCRRRGLKINADESEVMVLDGEEGLECEILEGGVRLERMSEFKHLSCGGLNEVGTDVAECRRKVGEEGKLRVRKITQGPGIVKGLEDKQDHG